MCPTRVATSADGDRTARLSGAGADEVDDGRGGGGRAAVVLVGCGGEDVEVGVADADGGVAWAERGRAGAQEFADGGEHFEGVVDSPGGAVDEYRGPPEGAVGVVDVDAAVQLGHGEEGVEEHRGAFEQLPGQVADVGVLALRGRIDTPGEVGCGGMVVVVPGVQRVRVGGCHLAEAEQGLLQWFTDDR
ncbi:hypothetical protein [Nocardia transvalensis]|uniref:hypothetical protein n=1 Tax=Nocardia transvalensis TaxID=37333 RepID=UPI003A5CFB76